MLLLVVRFPSNQQDGRADSIDSYTVYNMSLALYTRAVDGHRTLRTRRSL